MPEEKPLSKVLTGSVLVAVLTASGYIAAYAFQLSYLRYFGIPSYLIDLNLGLLLLTALVALVLVLPFVFGIYYFAKWNPKNKITHFFRWLLFTVFLVCIFSPVYLPANPLIIVTVILLIIIESIYLYKRLDTVDEKDEKGVLFVLEKKFGTLFVILICFIVLFIYYGYMMGTTVAKLKKDYLIIPSSDQSLVIVSTYMDSFVAVTLSTTSPHTFEKSITLISKDKISNDGIVLVNTTVGPLTHF